MRDPRSRPDNLGLESRWREIERKLGDASDALTRQGSVAARSTPGGTRVFSIRYMTEGDGVRKQKAVYIGADTALVDRARALIREFRERRRRVKEAEDAARFAVASAALLRRLLTGRGSPAGGSSYRPGRS